MSIVMTKEELSMFLESPVWQQIRVDLGNYQEDARQDLLGLDFSRPESNLKAVACQAKIEAVDEIFSSIDNLKSEAKD